MVSPAVEAMLAAKGIPPLPGLGVAPKAPRGYDPQALADYRLELAGSRVAPQHPGSADRLTMELPSSETERTPLALRPEAIQMVATVRNLSSQAPNSKGMNAYPAQLNDALTLNPARDFLLTEAGRRPTLADTQSAAFQVGDSRVTLVGVGEVAGVEAVDADVVVGSRNYSSCASVCVRGTRNGVPYLLQGHFTAEPGGTQTQHGNVEQFLTKNQPKGFVPQEVLIAVDGFNREEGALDPAALPKIAPTRIVQSSQPGSDAYRNVYVGPHGVLIETFQGRNQRAGDVGQVQFEPWSPL
jgi:hypothetical protein